MLERTEFSLTVAVHGAHHDRPKDMFEAKGEQMGFGTFKGVYTRRLLTAPRIV